MPTFSAQTTSSSPATTRPNSPSSNLQRHLDYYLPGGDLFIQVATTLFCVHAYFFTRESPLWRHLLRNTTLGRDAQHPIVLANEFHFSPPATPQTFAQFLYVFYNNNYGRCNLSMAALWDIDVYATTWRMQPIKDFVHRELRQIVRYHHQQRAATSWLSLSRFEESERSSSSSPDTWNLSDQPYEDWISNPDVVDEVSLLLNQTFLEDGRD
jgi:hypothetical protein